MECPPGSAADLTLVAPEGWGFEAMAESRSRLVHSQGPRELAVAPLPFVVGRSRDCQLVLPQDERLRALTSRWHCHFLEAPQEVLVADGSLNPVAEHGGPKPSVTGTRLNGRAIAAPAPVHDGDVIELGPWRFTARHRRGSETLVAEGLLERQPAQVRTMDTTDPRALQRLGDLHELVFRTARSTSTDEALDDLLAYATATIQAASATAVLCPSPAASEPAVRAAWLKGYGRARRFRHSESLLRALDPERSSLLEVELRERSESQTACEVSSGLLLPLWGRGERVGVLYFDNRGLAARFTEDDLLLASAIAVLVSQQLTLERHARLVAVKESMTRYFAPDVVDQIVRRCGDGATGLDIVERDVTVLFVDIEGFTAMSHRCSPRELAALLNPFLETVVRRVQAAGGHVNKFLGDGAMAVFGAQPNVVGRRDPSIEAARAVQAALDLPLIWESESARRGLPLLAIRTGINSGRALVGDVGYPGRVEYTVVGEVVNVAARLQQLAASNRCAASELTYALTDRLFEYEASPPREVKGVGRMAVYSPLRSLRSLS